jgi:predicted Zn-dependent protease
MTQRALALLLLIPLLTVAASAQRGGTPVAAVGTITGAVHTVDNQPVADARVELHQMANGNVVASTYTSFDGGFEFRNLTAGTYEVIVTSGLSRVSEATQVHDDLAQVNLRLPSLSRDGKSDAGDKNSVSVAAMKVPDKARDAYKKAQKAALKHDAAEANKQLERALEIYPKFAEALTLRGLMRLEAEQTKDAIADLENAVDADNNYALAFFVLGSAYNVESHFDDAIRVLDRGVSLAPNSWQAYFELAKAYVGKDDLAAASRQINKAADLAPKEYAPVHLIRANILLKQKNYPEAMSELEAYLEREPSGPNSASARQTLEQVKAFVAQK